MNTTFENNIFRGGLTAPEPAEVDMKAVEANAPRFSALFNPLILMLEKQTPLSYLNQEKSCCQTYYQKQEPQKIYSKRVKILWEMLIKMIMKLKRTLH